MVVQILVSDGFGGIGLALGLFEAVDADGDHDDEGNRTNNDSGDRASAEAGVIVDANALGACCRLEVSVRVVREGATGATHGPVDGACRAGIALAGDAQVTGVAIAVLGTSRISVHTLIRGIACGAGVTRGNSR